LDAVEVDKPDDDDVSLWSVTTIIGALDKPALLYWAAEQAANAAVDNLATWQAMLEDRGREEAVKWLRDARFRQPKNILSSADLGTITHKVCESYALTGTKPDQDFITDLVAHAGTTQTDVTAEAAVVTTMLDRFDGWLHRFQPEYQATEVCVYSPTYGYAGQADAFLSIDGTRFIVDYKTTREPFDSRGSLKTPYPEQVGLQLAAYRNAEYAAVWRPRRFEKFRRRYYLLSASERELAVPVPEVDTGLVIQLSPESCEAYPIRCDTEVHTAFLYVLEAFRWLQETSKTVMSDALQEGK
jgi:ATP-dependent exoDNAse (exonuclease V) beta subunit